MKHITERVYMGQCNSLGRTAAFQSGFNVSDASLIKCIFIT